MKPSCPSLWTERGCPHLGANVSLTVLQASSQATLELLPQNCAFRQWDITPQIAPLRVDLTLDRVHSQCCLYIL